jgi:hypothetical protein
MDSRYSEESQTIKIYPITTEKRSHQKEETDSNGSSKKNN